MHIVVCVYCCLCILLGRRWACLTNGWRVLVFGSECALCLCNVRLECDIHHFAARCLQLPLTPSSTQILLDQIRCFDRDTDTSLVPAISLIFSFFGES